MGSVESAEIMVPTQPLGWALVARGTGEADRHALLDAVSALHGAHVATCVIDLPGRTSTAAQHVQATVTELRQELAGTLPVTFLAAGRQAAAGWMAAERGALDGVIAHNGRSALSRRLGHVDIPTLLLVDQARAGLPVRLLGARALSWRLGGDAQLELVSAAAPVDPELIGRWYEDRVSAQSPVLLPVRSRAGAPRRASVKLAVAAAVAVPALGGLAAMPATAAAGKLPNFTAGKSLSAAQIGGDGAKAAVVKPASDKPAAHSLRGAQILGDRVEPHATGSGGLIDGDGLKFFVNTNITFSTTSSASGAASEASYTHSVEASTLNGGVTATRLNDAYDGYETLCISTDNTTGNCQTGTPNWSIYLKNGPATPETSNSQQYDFPVETVGDVQMSRKVFVPDNDGFARWLDVFTNTGSTPVTITAAVANNLGSDNNTVITADSLGDTSPTTADTWVASFQNWSGNTSSDVRLGHVLDSEGATMPASVLHFVNGDDNPYWNYQVTIPAGGTRIVMNYGVGQATQAAAAAKSAQLAGLTDANQLNFMTAAEQAEVVNFAIPTQAVADSYLVTAGSPLTVAAPGVLGNDPDPTDVTAVLLSGPAHAASFTLNADGSFAYTPTPGYTGTDSFTYASQGAGGGQSTPTTVTLNEAPAITSAASAAFTEGTSGSFTVDATGGPTPSLSTTSTLPAGLTFTDNGNGTATISGTPAAGTAGSPTITVRASNGEGTDATQTLTLNIAAAPAPTPTPTTSTPSTTTTTPVTTTTTMPVTTTTTPAVKPPLVKATYISLSTPEVVWCYGKGCQFPNTQIRFSLNRAAPVRLLLQARIGGKWKQIATSTIDGHAGANKRVLAGRWHGALVPARAVRILVQTRPSGTWKTQKTLSLVVKHRRA